MADEGHHHGAEVGELRRSSHRVGHAAELGTPLATRVRLQANSSRLISYHLDDKNARCRALARACPRELADAIEPELPDGDRGDPGHDRPRGARVRPAAGGRLRRGDPHRRQRGAAPVRRPDPRPGRRPRARARRLRRRSGAASCARAAPSTRCSPPTGSARGSPGGGSRPRPGARGVDPEQLGLLAEAIFAYIDELSADSVEGYAQAQREQEGERQRRRRELLALLLRDPPARGGRDRGPRRRPPAGGSPRSAAPLAVRGGRPRPGRHAACPPTRWPRSWTGSAAPSCRAPASPSRAAELGAGGRVGHRGARPDGPARGARGPPGRWPRRPCAPAEAGALEAAGPIVAEDAPRRAAALRVRRPARTGSRERRLAPLAELTPAGRDADGGDGARLRPARRQRRGDGAGAPPAPADDPLPARRACASCSAISSTTRTPASSSSWRSGQLGRGGQLGQLAG